MDESTADADDAGKLPPLSIAEQGVLPSTHPQWPALSASAIDEYGTFYREFVPHLVAFLVWQGARLSDAADFAQETMIKAYRNWSVIEHPSCLGQARCFPRVRTSHCPG